MPVKWNKREVQGDIRDAGVGLEDRKDAEEGGDHEERLPPQPDCQPTHISGKV